MLIFAMTPKMPPKLKNHRRFFGAEVTIILGKMQAHI